MNGTSSNPQRVVSTLSRSCDIPEGFSRFRVLRRDGTQQQATAADRVSGRRPWPCAATYLDRQQAIEEFPVALQREAKIFRGHVFPARPLLLQLRASLREAVGELLNDV